ncbi:MAG: Holliday junction branch migration protein RuvA [Gemmatimonadaceae bacterium]
MIAQVTGTLVAKHLDRVEVMTTGGLSYDIAIPIGVFETLPRSGEQARLHTHLVVKDDGWQLYGFATAFQRQVFRRVLDAKGVGPALALGLLSALTAERLVRAIRDKDIATLQTVPRVGRKKAEQLVLDLADKVDDLRSDTDSGDPRPERVAADDAVRALVSLGYGTVDAENAVRLAFAGGGQATSAPELIRLALAKIGGR